MHFNLKKVSRLKSFQIKRLPSNRCIMICFRGNDLCFLKSEESFWSRTFMFEIKPYLLSYEKWKFRFSRKEKNWKKWLKKRRKNTAPEKDIAQGQNQMHSGAATYLLIIRGSGLVEHNIFHLVCKYLFWLCS